MILWSKGGDTLAVNPRHVVKAALVKPVSGIIVGVDKAKVTMMYMTGTTESVTFDTTKEAEEAFRALVSGMNA